MLGEYILNSSSIGACWIQIYKTSGLEAHQYCALVKKHASGMQDLVKRTKLDKIRLFHVHVSSLDYHMTISVACWSVAWLVCRSEEGICLHVWVGCG